MNKFIKVSFCMVSVLVILVSMCPISAFAVSTVYAMPFSQPTVTPYSGYIECLWKSSSSSSYFVSVHTWNYTPLNNDDRVSDDNFPAISLTRNSSSLKLTLSRYYDNSGRYSFSDMTSQDFVYYSSLVNDAYPTRETLFSFSGYSLAGVHIYGSYDEFNDLNSYSDADFTVSYSSDSSTIHLLFELISSVDSLATVLNDPDYTQQLNSIITALNNIDYSDELYSIEQSLGDITDFNAGLGQMLTANLSRLVTLGNNMLDELKKISGNTETIVSSLEVLSSCLDSMLDKLDDINQGLVDIFQFLETWIIDIDNWLSELYWIELDSNSKLYEIKDTLDAILNLLNKYSDVTFPSRDNSDLSEYFDIEHSLLDDSNIDVSEVFGDVTLNSNALQVIFGTFDDILNVHPKIIGFVILILSLGLVALILGR